MLRQSVILAVFGCVLTGPVPRPQHQYQTQQQQVEGIPPHLLRQYIGQQQAQAPTVIARPVAAAPARLPYSAQSEDYQPQYQQQYQQQPQQQQQYRPQYQQRQPAQEPQEDYDVSHSVFSRLQPYLAQSEDYQPQYQQHYEQQPQQYRPQYQQRQPGQEPQEDYDHHPSYQFGFDVNDDQYTNYQNRKEQRDGDVIKGSYSVVDSDGFVRTVTYTADPKEGFKAEVSRQPTDIVVKIPTPKPQLLQHQQHQQHQQPQVPQVAHVPRQQPQGQQLQQHQHHLQQQQQAPQYYRYTEQ